MEPGSRRPGAAGGEPPEDAGIAIVMADAGWRRLLPRAEALARRAVAATLAAEGYAADEPLGVTVLLADDRFAPGGWLP